MRFVATDLTVPLTVAQPLLIYNPSDTSVAFPDQGEAALCLNWLWAEATCASTSGMATECRQSCLATPSSGLVLVCRVVVAEDHQHVVDGGFKPASSRVRPCSAKFTQLLVILTHHPTPVT